MGAIKAVGYFIAAVAALFLLLVFSFMLKACTASPEEKARMDEKASEREAIAKCRDAQDDELQELATRRVLRSVCDKLEGDFEQKWGVSP